MGTERNKIGAGNKYIVKLAQALGTPVAYLMDLETDASEHSKPADKAEPVQTEINFEQVDKNDTVRKTSVDKGTLVYTFGDKKLEVPNTPETAPLFWAIVNQALQPQAKAAV